MAATPPVNRFQLFYATVADPYAADIGLLHETYGPEGANTPTVLLSMTQSTTYPLAYLVGAAGGRVYPILAPFDQPTLPGQGQPRKYGLIGDVSAQGTLPPLTEITSEYFRLTSNQAVPSIDDMDARWTAAQGEHYLPLETVGVNGAESIRTRHMMPVPHQYIGQILAEYNNGGLTWRWIWLNVALAILQDPAQRVAYETFLNFLRVSSTRRAGATPADAPRLSASVLELTAAITPVSVNDQGLELCRRFLPGLRAPDNVASQLAHLAQQGIQTQQLITTTSATPTPTLGDKAPHLRQVVELLTESTDPTTWPAYWTLHPTLKSGSWLSAMESMCLEVATKLRCQMPVLSPSLATDIAAGRFSSLNGNDVMHGISIFRIRTVLSREYNSLQQRNTVYSAMTLGTGTGQMSAFNMVCFSPNHCIFHYI